MIVENSLGYLLECLKVLEERHTSAQKERKGLKEELESLKKDIEGIQTKRLQDAAMKAFNHLSMQHGTILQTIKEIREDLKWVRVLITQVRGLNK